MSSGEKKGGKKEKHGVHASAKQGTGESGEIQVLGGSNIWFCLLIAK